MGTTGNGIILAAEQLGIRLILKPELTFSQLISVPFQHIFVVS